MLLRPPNATDVSSRRHRLSIPDLQPPPGRRRLRSVMLINPSASSPPPLLPSISAKMSSHAFSCQPSILPIAHRGFRPPPLCPRCHFSRSVESSRLQDSGYSARTPSFTIHTFLVRCEEFAVFLSFTSLQYALSATAAASKAERHCGIPMQGRMLQQMGGASTCQQKQTRAASDDIPHLFRNGCINLEVWEPVPGKPSEDPGSP